MLTLSQFITKPKIVAKRDHSILPKAKLIKCESIGGETESYLLQFEVKSSSGKTYHSTLQLYTGSHINGNTPVKLKCDCMSFKFEYEVLLHQQGSLYGEPSSNKLPKKDKSIFVCKHLHALVISLIRLGNIKTVRGRIQ